MKPKITIGKHSGFCFGVKRAYDLACVNSKDCDRLYILGKLVHNKDVCDDLKVKGIREVNSLDELVEGSVIFTAHGMGPKSYDQAKETGLRIIDTTCPKVMKTQRLAKIYAEKKYQVIIFGDKHHKEVISISEWSGDNATIVKSLRGSKKLKLDKNKKYCLISQTTQNVEEFEKVKNYFAGKLPNFVFFSTICRSTDSRQHEVRKLAKDNDATIVIGGRDSANSRRLFEIAKKINPRSHFIENEKQLKKSWLKGIYSIAICAGASTPERAIKRTVDKIKKLA